MSSINYNQISNNNKFSCDVGSFADFQKDLMGFLTNYMDEYNKQKFFEINVWIILIQF